MHLLVTHLVLVAPLLLDVLWWALAWVILIVVAAIVLVVQLLALLLRLVLRPLAVVLVHALGLGELVDLGTSKASEELLCKLVADWLACDRS